jgi:hypothetical protein
VKNDTAKMLLFCIELYRRRDKIQDISALEYRYTLEHVMPISWKEFWSDVPIVDESGLTYPDNDEQGIGCRDASIRSIGNLTLLTSNLNSSLRNAAFRVKMEGQGETRPGYRSHTSLTLTNEIVVKYIGGDTVWDEMHIKERTKRLYNEVLELWPFYENSEIMQAMEDEIIPVDADPEIDDFDDETLADPIKVLKALD